MIRNYLKTGFRNLWNHRLFSALNIFGLAVSMSVCMLVILVLRDQYGYDLFHENGDRIFRVISDKAEKNIPLKRAAFATAPMSLAEPLLEQYPFIEQATHVVSFSDDILINGKTYTSDEESYAVDQAFLDMFSFGWIAGDQQSALMNPRSVVLTASAAKRLFQQPEPLGAPLELRRYGVFSVTGIILVPPHRSHIRFDCLFSYSSIPAFSEEQRTGAGINGYDELWRGMVYLLLSNKNDLPLLDKALAEQSAAYTVRDKKEHFLFESQAFGDIMPSGSLMNEIGTGTPVIILNFLVVLGLIIIVSACFNYMNLSLARSIKRAKEIGVRKVIGAGKRDIVLQFLGEALMISLFAFVVAVSLLELLIPAFFGLDPFIGTIFKLDRSISNYAVLFGFSLLVGLAAGLLPALHISRFQALQAIQRLANIKVFSRVLLRKALITVQFAFSLIFILVVLIVQKQQKHVLSADLGLNFEDVLYVRMQGLDYNLFAQKVSQIKGVEEVSYSNVVMLTGDLSTSRAYYHDRADSMEVHQAFVSPNYISNMQIKLLAGQSFPKENPSQGEQFVILNETAARRLGFSNPEEALGQSLVMDGSPLSVIGVTRDFHYDNIWFSPGQPFVLRSNPLSAFNACVRLSGIQTAETVAAIHNAWEELAPGTPCIARFSDEQVYFLAKFFRMGSRIIGFVGFLTILISCMGLLGMVVYTVEGKVKEVGIRKVLGAGAGDVMWHLSKGFVWLLGISIVIAVPVTMLAANLWLDFFPLRTTVGPTLIGAGIAILLVLGILTVLSQTFYAALANPVKSLRGE